MAENTQILKVLQSLKSSSSYSDREALKQLQDLLEDVRSYVEDANGCAESLHDDPDSDSYMEYAYLEIMEETEHLLNKIDEVLDL